MPEHHLSNLDDSFLIDTFIGLALSGQGVQELPAISCLLHTLRSTKAQESRFGHSTALARNLSSYDVICAQIVKPDEPDSPDALEKGEAKGDSPAGVRPMQRDDTAHGSLARRAEARGAEE